jgi:hypothetical protein
VEKLDGLQPRATAGLRRRAVPAKDVLRLPTQLPTPNQLELPRAQLVDVAQEVANELLIFADRFMTTANAAEFATAVGAIADKLAEAAANWEELSGKIRESWFR